MYVYMYVSSTECPPNCDTCTQADGRKQCFSCFTGYVMAGDKNCNGKYVVLPWEKLEASILVKQC